MKTKKQIIDWLLENTIDDNGDLNLEGLDFTDFDGDVRTSHMKVKKTLHQANQNVKGDLHQSYQNVEGGLHQDSQNVEGTLRQSYQYVKGDLHQSYQNVEGHLFQSYQKVKLNLYQKYQNVKGTLYQDNQNVEGSLIQQAITPPTEEELCDILSNSIGHKVSYDKTRMLFATSCHLVAQLTVDGLRIGFHFKPHIVTMLGQFFESKVKGNE